MRLVLLKAFCLLLVYLFIIPAVGPLVGAGDSAAGGYVSAAEIGEGPLKLTHAVAPPYAYIDNQGIPRGLLIDFWTLWSESAGRQVEFVLTSHEQSIEMVRNGEADFHMGLFRSENLDTFLDFSDNFMIIQASVFVWDELGIRDVSGLAGYEIGVNRGQYSSEFITSNFPQAAVRFFDNDDDLYFAVLRGDLKVFVEDCFITAHYLQNSIFAGRFDVIEEFSVGKMRAAVREGNEDVMTPINMGLLSVVPEGAEAVCKRWMPAPGLIPAGVTRGFLTILGFAALAGLMVYIAFLRWQIIRSRNRLRDALGDIAIPPQEKGSKKGDTISLEQIVQKARSDYQSIFDSVTVQILYVNSRQKVIRANKAAAVMLGDPVETLIGKTLFQLYGKDADQFLRGNQKVMESGLTVSGEKYNYSDKRGVEKWMEITRIPYFEKDSTIGGVIIMAQDITEREKLESEREKLLQESNAAADKIKVLQGLIPVCSNCRKLQGDAEAWQKVEDYFKNNTDAETGELICPDCAKELQ